MTAHNKDPRWLAFGPFLLDRAEQSLKRGRAPIHLRSREMDILLYLIDRPGHVVTTDELINDIWPAVHVSEANLRVQIAGLSRALSTEDIGGAHERESYIRKVGENAYQFRGALQAPVDGDDVAAQASFPAPSVRAPGKTLIGRDAELARLLASLPSNRLITLTGTGGVGKTALALTAGAAVNGAYADGVWFVDLSFLDESGMVAGAIAMALDLSSRVVTISLDEALVERLAPLNMLLILDNCEQVVSSVATTVNLILARAKGISVLATSRLPLQADTECLFPVAPLAHLPIAAGSSARPPRNAGAVRLFTERAQAGETARISDEDGDIVADLCRRLDGNPLAIELTAGLVPYLGLQTVATELAGHLEATAATQSTPAPASGILESVLGWSYSNLCAAEQALLRQLSIFRGDFTLASAEAVDGGGLTSATLLKGLAGLAAKALITVNDRRSTPHAATRYRLPVLVRDFAYRELIESEDFQTVAGRHAQRILEIVKSPAPVEIDLGMPSLILDIRAAIGWAFFEGRDPLIWMQLMSITVEAGRHLPIFGEYAQNIGSALERIGQVPGLDPRYVLSALMEKLHLDLHANFNPADWNRLMERAAVFAQRIYEATQDASALLDIRRAQFSQAFGEGNGPGQERAYEKLEALAIECRQAESMKITLQRFECQALHFNGRHRQALAVADSVLAYSDEMIRRRDSQAGDRIDPRISAGIVHARGLWLTGRGAEASEAGLKTLDMARSASEYAPCYVLAFAIVPVHHWRGDMAAAAAATAELLQVAAALPSAYWEHWGHAYQAALSAQGYGVAGLAGLRMQAIQVDHLATIHDSFIDEATYRRASEGLVNWCAPELFRAHAERSLASGRMGAASAEALLGRALGMARAHAAVAWELRAATSLARLWGYQGKTRDGIDLLNGVLALFNEGFGDADLISAQALLTDLSKR